MKDISISGNVLIVDGVEVPFKYNIREFVQINDVVAVRLEVRARDDDINNIYGVIDNKIAWRVQDMLEYDENCAPFMPDPYTGIDAYDKNPELIIAVSAYGFRYLIDPKTGKIVGEESFVK